MSPPTFIDFFAGSGLVSEGAKRHLTPVWANDICPRKMEIYRQNHPSNPFVLESVERISGKDLPAASVVWGSFPCQDLSLAGNRGGLAATRSGLFWEWLRVVDEMPERPRVLALENVVGLLTSGGGADYREIHQALAHRKYRVGPMVLDAARWLPQSRPRLFVVAADDRLDTSGFETEGTDWNHPLAVRKATREMDAVWWRLPEPTVQPSRLSKILDWAAPVNDPASHARLFGLVSERHRKALDAVEGLGRRVFPGYRRTRNGRQVLELRFDDRAGCLRTAKGGSSRQFLILRDRGEWSSRLLTPREAASLMGAPADYWLPDSYSDAYNAMGDAVAVPAVEHLSKHLLAPLAGLAPTADEARRPTPRFCLRA